MKPTNLATREAWLEARRELLEAEKRLTQQRDDVARKRRELPWVLVTEDYRFDAEAGEASLIDLFADCSQLVVQHFMFGADWEEGCKSCSFWADNLQGALPHLRARDVAYVAVSQAPLPVLTAFKTRMGWVHDWVSCAPCNFGNDYHVWHTPEQIAAGETSYNYRDGPVHGEHLPGFSVFARDEDGAVYHTYSAYARGLDPLNGAYQLLDLVPKGRDEAELSFPMAWVNHHDHYPD